MKLKQIHRTSTFSWSPVSAVPLLATGTVAGALDESFSNESALEIWDMDFLNAGEYELGLSAQEGGREPKGVVKDSSRFNRVAWGASDVIAAGMENGELALWDPKKIIAGQQDDALILRNSQHTGPVRGLDINPTPNQSHLLSTGALGGDVCIWDLKDPSKPYSPTPGTKSTKLDEITSLAWNRVVPYILGGSSSTGYTVVWDLRRKREVVALSGAAAASRGGGTSDLAWCPDNATRVVTASEDDASPVVMVWDLRNARAPEKTLSGHDKGILSLSWCSQDPGILLSCGKDNRTICWNPDEGSVVAELPTSSNWSFQVAFNPKNPSLFATAFFDGTIGIHSLQSTADEFTTPALPPTTQKADSDLFDAIATTAHAQPKTKASSIDISDKHVIRWLKRPVNVAWGFGGRIVSVNQKSVGIRKVGVTDGLGERTKTIVDVVKGGDITPLSQAMAGKGGVWDYVDVVRDSRKDGGKSREDLIRLVGWTKAEGIAKVREGISEVKGPEEAPEPPPVATPTITPADDARDATPTSGLAADDSSASLFTSTTDNAPDFFSNISAADPSIAATIGSPPSSPAPVFGSQKFQITPEACSDVDRLLTKALIFGDFQGAVEVCISTGRWADALLLASSDKSPSAPELIRKVQKAYFEHATAEGSYLRLWQSVVWMDDLEDVVQNADLAGNGWKQIFTVLCVFSRSQSEFDELVESLGRRLEFESPERSTHPGALICYVASGRLERIVSVWIEEMASQESRLLKEYESAGHGGHYDAHVEALVTLMEKVAVLRSALAYVDPDLSRTKGTEWKLSSLYEKYVEMAEVLASQGSTAEARVLINVLVPKGFEGVGRMGGLLENSTQPAAARPYAAPATTAYTSPVSTYSAPTVVPGRPYAGPSTTYATGAGSAYPAASTTQQGYSGSPYAPPPQVGVPQAVPQFVGGAPQQQPPANAYAPPSVPGISAPPLGRGPAPAPPPPPVRTTNAGGWNDMPQGIMQSTHPRPASASANKQAITSPFPNQPPPPASPYGSGAGAGMMNASANAPPAPMRPGSRGHPASIPPPPKAGQRPPSVPPQRMMSPPASATAGRASTPGQYGPPPPQHHPGMPPPRPGHSFAPPPQAGQFAPPPPATSPYAPPPTQANRSPPPSASHPNPYAPSVAQTQSPYAPPPGAATSHPPPGSGNYGPPPLLATQGPGGQPQPPPPPPAPAKKVPTGPKYPPGDRSHIPEHAMIIFEVISSLLASSRQAAGPQQKRLFDDLEKRINPLFDGLNCETIGGDLIDGLVELSKAMQARDKGAALAMHVDLITKGGPGSEAIGLPMSGIKQLIMRL